LLDAEDAAQSLILPSADEVADPPLSLPKKRLDSPLQNGFGMLLVVPLWLI
jgi:hypothetical protein